MNSEALGRVAMKVFYDCPPPSPQLPRRLRQPPPLQSKCKQVSTCFPARLGLVSRVHLSFTSVCQICMHGWMDACGHVTYLSQTQIKRIRKKHGRETFAFPMSSLNYLHLWNCPVFEFRNTFNRKMSQWILMDKHFQQFLATFDMQHQSPPGFKGTGL